MDTYDELGTPIADLPNMVWGSRTGAVKARVEKGRPRRGWQAGGLCLGRRGSALTRADDDGLDWGWEYKL